MTWSPKSPNSKTLGMREDKGNRKSTRSEVLIQKRREDMMTRDSGFLPSGGLRAEKGGKASFRLFFWTRKLLKLRYIHF